MPVSDYYSCRKVGCARMAKLGGDGWCALHDTEPETPDPRDARITALEAEVARVQGIAFGGFVAGAKWWEFERTGATMWGADVAKAEKAAADRYPYAPHPLVVEANAQRDTALREVARLEALILQVEVHSVNPLLEDEADRIRSRTP